MACSLTLALTGQRAGTGPAPTLTACPYTDGIHWRDCCLCLLQLESFTGTLHRNVLAMSRLRRM